MTEPAAQPLVIVATGATIGTLVTPIVVTGGAVVDVRGISVASERAFQCGAATGPTSSLSLRESTLTALGNTSFFQSTRCSISIQDATIALNECEVVGVEEGTNLVLQRTRVSGYSSHHLAAYGSKVNIRIEDSLLQDVSLQMMTTDPTPPGTEVFVSHSTLVHTLFSLPTGCTPSANRRVHYENSIIATSGEFDALQEPGCTFRNTVLSRQASPPAGTLVADPMFVDFAGRDFHLSGGSRAIDAAEPPTAGAASTLDLDRVPRPQGAKADIGAYEYRP